MAMEPWPAKLRRATWTYTGRAPNNVTTTRITVAIGATAPAGKQRDARLVAKSREVVHASQPHNLPPAMGRHLLDGVVVHGLASRQPLPDAGSVLERGLGQPLAKGDARVLFSFGLRARRRWFLDWRLRAVRHLSANPPWPQPEDYRQQQCSHVLHPRGGRRRPPEQSSISFETPD